MRKFDFNDAVTAVGLLLAIAGVALIHRPTAMIIGGVLIAALGLLASGRKS